MASQANLPLPDGAPLDEYRVERLLASGGFSFVYLARHPAGGRVAVKEYLPATLPLRTGRVAALAVRDEHRATFQRGLQCFFAEAKALVRLRHPNVVRVLKFFRANGTAYLAMRYEPGRTLQHLIESGDEPRREDWVRAKFARLLNGLREVHSNRLVHLDIKPGNVYVRDDGEPMLLDFGGARAALGGQLADLPPTYTPGFASPEHHGGGGVLGPWSDIYSVGACLYACLAAEAPPPATERLKGGRLLALPGGWAGRHSASLVRIVDQCMRLDHEERPRSVLALQKMLLGETPLRPAGKVGTHPQPGAWALEG